MKKIFTSLIVAILSLIMAFSVACNKDKGNSERESTPNTESNSIETTPNQSTPDDGDESTPEDEKHLGDDVIDILNPILGNDFINFSMTVELDVAPYIDAFTSIDAYVKNTDNGYDAIINIITDLGQTVTGSDIYYIDGVAVTGSGAIVDEERVDWYYELTEVGTVDELLDIFVENFEANAPEDYEMVKTMVDELKVMLEDADFKNINEIFDFNLAETLNQVINGFFALEEVPIYNLILSIAGIDLSDSISEANFEAALNSIYEYLETNPTIADVINSIIDSVNADLPLEERINLEAIINEIQAQIGMSTVEIVAGIKATSPDFDKFFRDANQDESLYDYLDSYASIIKVNMISESIIGEGVTFVDAIKGLIEQSKQITFKQFFNSAVNGIMAMIGGTQLDSGITTIITESGEIGGENEPTTESGEMGGENEPTTETVDYFELLKSYNLSFQVFTIRGEIRTDNVGRPASFDLSLSVEFTFDTYDYENAEIVTQEIEINGDVAVKVSYVKPTIEFEIPQEILDVAVPSGGEVEEVE